MLELLQLKGIHPYYLLTEKNCNLGLFSFVEAGEKFDRIFVFLSFLIQKIFNKMEEIVNGLTIYSFHLRIEEWKSKCELIFSSIIERQVLC